MQRNLDTAERCQVHKKRSLNTVTGQYEEEFVVAYPTIQKRLLRTEQLCSDANVPQMSAIKVKFKDEIATTAEDTDEYTAIDKHSHVDHLGCSLSKMKIANYTDPMYKTPSKDKNEGRQLAEEKQVVVQRKSYEFHEKQTTAHYSPISSISKKFDSSLEISEFEQLVKVDPSKNAVGQ